MPNGATRRVASWYWVGKILWMLGGHLAHLYRLCGLCPQLLVRDPRASTQRFLLGPFLLCERFLLGSFLDVK
jgi:hypothetical protein